MKFKIWFFLLGVLFFTTAFSQTADRDGDGVSDMEDVCPADFGTKANKGCPEEKKEITEEDKKIFLKNFQTILQHIPQKFEKLKTGEEDIDISSRISWFKSNLQLFPNHTDKNKTQLMYGMYSGKPVIAFIENAPVDVNTVVKILMPVLKAKGMTEVNTKFAVGDPAARSFRSKEAVLQINTGKSAGTSILNIGKLPYYYESDVKPVAVTKPRPAPIAPKNNVIELKQAILKANEAVKKNKNAPFAGLANTITGQNILFASAKETIWQIKNMFNSVVLADGSEICIQLSAGSDEQLAKLRINPCKQLGWELGTAYKENFDYGDNYMATYDNVTITYAVMQGPDYQYAPFIFIRPVKITDSEALIEDANAVFITSENFRIILHKVCENSMHLNKRQGEAQPGRSLTNLNNNGKQKNLPVSYHLSADGGILKVFVPLSKNKKDFDAILKYINELFSTTTACSGNYKKLSLEKSAKEPNTANGVDAFDDYGITLSLRENIVSAKEKNIELTITRIDTREKKPVISSQPGSAATCGDFKTVFEAAGENFKQVKGKKLRFVNAFESHYEANLPLLGANEGKLVEEFLDGKHYYHYETNTYKSTQEVTALLNRTMQQLEKCYKLHRKLSDTEKNNRRIVEYRVDGDDGQEYYIKFEMAAGEKGMASLWMYFHPPGD